jgi:hypothetical protein
METRLTAMLVLFPGNYAERCETRKLHSVLLPDERTSDGRNLLDLATAFLRPTFDKPDQRRPSDVLAPAEVNLLEIRAQPVPPNISSMTLSSISESCR